MFLVLSLSIVCLTGVLSSDDGLQVKTPYGTYKGHLIKSRSGRDLVAFKGIPYAQAPVGHLRFMDPVKLNKSDAVMEADKDHVCYQCTLALTGNADGKYIGEEDCLYLNIYKPKEVKSDKLPVFIVIHGGGYKTGSENWSGARFLLDKPGRDMVVIMINYRLGVLGFLSANKDTVPGNLGLKDQTMALKWVKENIHAFGGDPDSVTIGGISAGGSSVHQHMLSKASKGLFHRAISQSGTNDCSWSHKTPEEANHLASKVISKLDCPSEPKQLLECLQKQPVEKLIDADAKDDLSEGYIMTMVPVIEEDSPTAFMTKESVQEGSDIPWLTGVTNEEGLTFYQIFVVANSTYKNLSIFEDNYKKLFPKIAYYDTRPGKDAASEKIKEFYFSKGFNKESVKDFLNFISDTMFIHGLTTSARHHKGKTFMYELSYKGEHSFTKLFPAVTLPDEGIENSVAHGDDMFLLFDILADLKLPFSTLDVPEKDRGMSETMIDMWYNFISHGDPTPETHLWEESDKGKKYLEFTNDGPKMRTEMLFKDRMDFLDKLEETLNKH